MELMSAWLLLLLFCFAGSQFRRGAGLFVQDPEAEWERMVTVISEEMREAPVPESKLWRSGGSSTPTAKNFPQFVVVPASKVQKEVFKPEKGARPLPKPIKDMLLGATVAAPTMVIAVAAKPPLVEILCHIDRIYVRIRREVFKTRGAYKHLQFGTCPVNFGNNVHYYFLYLLKSNCGFKMEGTVDYVNIRNVLNYKPPGPVSREMPFAIPLQCKYPRFFHSFKAGFYPKLQGGTVFKALQQKSSFTLTPQDASGNEITDATTYTLGQPMYFEAKQPDSTTKSGDQRIYINKCFMTASRDPSSNPKYTVIENKGCMIDGMVTDQSKFLAGASKKTQRFSIGAFIFKDMVSSQTSTQQLYMHCEVFIGKLTPTLTSKACNYDLAAKKWKELYGDDSVCVCCGSTCPSAGPKASRNIISSHSWKVNLSNNGHVEDEPQTKSSDTFHFEDTDEAEQEGHLTYWEPDY